MRGAGGSLDDDFDDDACADLREVVVRYRAEVYRFARSLTHSNADAEDLAQSAALRALERSEPLHDPRRAKSYLFTIVRNLATDQARRRARIVMEPRAEVPEIPARDAAGDAAFAWPESWTDNWAEPHDAIAGLARAHREILEMRFFEDLDNAAIADRLQISEHAARQRVYRAMQTLRAAARARKLAS